MYVVGVSGGIGSGKSAVTDRFADLGITVVDADIASRIVVEPGKPALQDIADHFGAELIAADGSLDRAALRSKVFAEESERKWLESLLHPLINQEIADQLAASTSDYTVLVSPILIETGQNRMTHRVLIVDVPEQVQLERTMSRDDNSEEQVRRIMAAQMDRETRLSHADDVIVNDATLDILHERVDALHAQYLQYASSHDGQ